MTEAYVRRYMSNRWDTPENNYRGLMQEITYKSIAGTIGLAQGVELTMLALKLRDSRKDIRNYIVKA